MTSKFLLATAAAAVLGTALPAAAETVVVTSPAGLFTNTGPANAAGPGAGLDTWFANNVRAGGSAGITAAQPRSGTGSIQFSGPANAKADFEYYFSTGNQFLLSDLTGFSYDYYRDVDSTAAAHFHPSLRLYVTDGARTGYLVYEGIYNGVPTSPVGDWTSVTVVGNGADKKIWSTGTLPDAASNYNRTAADWATLLPGLRVVGFSTGIGSGWNGSIDAAVDNISFSTRSGRNVTYNFEAAATAVPEPATWGLMLAGFGMVGAGLRSRRRARVTFAA